METKSREILKQNNDVFFNYYYNYRNLITIDLRLQRSHLHLYVNALLAYMLIYL